MADCPCGGDVLSSKSWARTGVNPCRDFPKQDVRLVEQILVHASPARVFDAFLNLEVSDMPMAKCLGAFQGLG